MKSIPQTQLATATVTKAAHTLCAEDQAFELDTGDALCQIRPDKETCVVIRLGSVVRRHFGVLGRVDHSYAVKQVLRIEYGINS